MDGTGVRRLLVVMGAVLVVGGCASNVRFVRTDDAWEPTPKEEGAAIVFQRGLIRRPHRVIGLIEAELGRTARRPDLDALIRRKALEIGADGVMLVEYDVDRNVYLEHHHEIVGAGPWRHDVVTTRPRARVRRTASAVAVVFEGTHARR